MADERVAALLARLGATERVSRELIEIGEPALAEVEAYAGDPARRRELRLLASRIAHEIRDRAMRAPAAPIDPRPRLGDAFWARHGSVEAFEARLREAGAVAIAIDDDTLIATLPDDAEARERVIAIHDAEAAALGEGFGGGRHDARLRFWWD